MNNTYEIQNTLIDTVREMANTKDCKQCSHFYLSTDKKPVCTFESAPLDECIVIMKQLNQAC